MFGLAFRSAYLSAARPPILGLVAVVWLAGSACLLPGAEEDLAETKIYQALGEKTEIEFRKTPLQDVVDHLSELHKIKIQLDKTVLEEVGIGADTPVTKRLNNVSLRAALRLMLRDLELTYVIDDEVLLITTPDEAETRLTTKFYPVADLVDRDPETAYSPASADFDPLIELITAIIAPESWEDAGGAGAVSEFAKAGALVVSQTHEVHEQIGQLLATLRRLRPAPADLKANRADRAQRDKQEIVRIYRVSNVKGLTYRSVTAVKDNVKGSAKDSVKHDAQAGEKTLSPDYAAAKRSADGLARLIKKAVAPKSWTEQHVIRVIPGTLVIRQSRRVQREINRLLKKMDLLDGATTLSPVAAMPARSELPISIRLGENAAEARILKALVERTEIDLLETPLRDFADFIRKKHQIEVELDRNVLEEAGIDGDTLLTRNLKGVSLRSALRLVLRDLELTFIIRDEVLLITTPDEANAQLATRLYPVKDLVALGDDAWDSGDVDVDADPLIDVIQSAVAPDSWDQAGGMGVIDFFEPSAALVVSQTEDVHRQIARLLQKLRAVRESQFKTDKNAKQAATDEPQLRVYRVSVGVDPTVPSAKTQPAAKKVGAARPIARNVLAQIGGFQGVGRGLVGGGGFGGGGVGFDPRTDPRRAALFNLAALPDDGSVDRVMQDLVALIQGSIEPQSWKGDEDAAIYTITGCIVVRHTAKVQRRVAALLSQTGLLVPKPGPPVVTGGMGGGPGFGGGGGF